MDYKDKIAYSANAELVDIVGYISEILYSKVAALTLLDGVYEQNSFYGLKLFYESFRFNIFLYHPELKIKIFPPFV